MKTDDLILLFKIVYNLDINQGLIMKANEQSIAIVKRKDQRGVYYSINDIVNNVVQKSNNNECAMTLLMTNTERFKYPQYNNTVVKKFY
jgi:hypothetical protein